MDIGEAIKPRVKESLSKRDLLQTAANDIMSVLKNKDIDKEEKTIELDPNYNDIVSKKSSGGKFAFWGLLADKFSFPKLEGQEYFPSIKKFQIPKDLWDEDLGTEIVHAWEQVFIDQDIKTFTVTDVNKDSIGFWEKMGYQIPVEEEHKPSPYYMYKKI